MENNYWFRSELFQVQKGEDKETNPGCYGKELGTWLCMQFKELGYKNVELIPEGWGWCVMCSNTDYMLWVGCGSIRTDEGDDNFDSASPPNSKDIVWHTFTVAEVPIFYFKSLVKKLFGMLNVDKPLRKLDAELAQILNSEPRIELCEEP